MLQNKHYSVINKKHLAMEQNSSGPIISQHAVEKKAASMPVLLVEGGFISIGIVCVEAVNEGLLSCVLG